MVETDKNLMQSSYNIFCTVCPTDLNRIQSFVNLKKMNAQGLPAELPVCAISSTQEENR